MITLPPRQHSAGVNAALDDLDRDIKSVLPQSEDTPRWTLMIEVNADFDAERYRLTITDTRTIVVEGKDDLGIIYGLYEFSERFLGVDPLWFWKDILPRTLDHFSPSPQVIESPHPTFRYRGWFINDEDLLGLWRTPHGQRFLNWPKRAETLQKTSNDLEENYENRLLEYYSPVISLETMEAVFEAALRLRINLIIPASFIDIFNEPETDVIRAAVRRGLYVSQHHVEPLGVSHFAYESWCAQNGYPDAPFSYREVPEIMRECWRAYAQRWYEIAGDNVIWQVGLRGRGDRPLWNHDPEAKARAADFVFAALNDQMEIIRQADKRRLPPATLTLWFEGADLIKSGQLRAPDGIIYVFADHYLTQELQDDFKSLPREDGREHGYYYHVAVWPLGPHLVQGPPPEKIIRTANDLITRGDTGYAILNVSNLREHTMGAYAWSKYVWDSSQNTATSLLESWATPHLAPLYAKFLDCFPVLYPGWRFYDGGARTFIERLICLHATGQPLDGLVKEVREDYNPTPLITDAIRRLSELLDELDAIAQDVPAYLHNFFCSNLVAQAEILRGLYQAAVALLPETPDLRTAHAGLDSVLKAYPLPERGCWANWYTGDTKMGIASLQKRIEDLLSR